MGEPPDHWMPELVDAVEVLGPASSAGTPTWPWSAAARVLVAAGERRAGRDLDRIVAGEAGPTPPTEPARRRALDRLARVAARTGRRRLLPVGMPADWLGQSIDVYGVPTVPGSSVSFAIRWHGERPAVLWEQTGDPIELSAPIVAPEWRSSDATGEALWPPPPGARPLTADADVTASSAIDRDHEPGSFS